MKLTTAFTCRKGSTQLAPFFREIDISATLMFKDSVKKMVQPCEILVLWGQIPQKPWKAQHAQKGHDDTGDANLVRS
ncbi:MAG: hypothetical protein H7A51_05780 [Akkermansiaceae bacterium]|nr:hypothetical protein [Akkermansiaceae bacterium]